MLGTSEQICTLKSLTAKNKKKPFDGSSVWCSDHPVFFYCLLFCDPAPSFMCFGVCVSHCLFSSLRNEGKFRCLLFECGNFSWYFNNGPIVYSKYCRFLWLIYFRRDLKTPSKNVGKSTFHWGHKLWFLLIPQFLKK